MAQDQIMVLSAFWGTGKSTFKQCFPMVYDYDEYAGQLVKDTTDNPYEVEIEKIEYYVSRGIPCLVSAHPELVKALTKKGVSFLLVYPETKMKDLYMKRYVNRGNDKSFIKNMGDGLFDSHTAFLMGYTPQEGSDKRELHSDVYLSQLVTYTKARGFHWINP